MLLTKLTGCAALQHNKPLPVNKTKTCPKLRFTWIYSRTKLSRVTQHLVLDVADDRCFYHLRQMRTVRRSLTEDAAKTTVHAFVTSRIDYCNSVIRSSNVVHILPLQNALNAAARLVLHKRKFDHIAADVQDRLHWLPLQQRVEYKVSLLIYKCLHQAAPSYLAEMCVPVSATDNRCSLRSATHGHLAVLRIRLARYRRRSFSVSGPLLWNSLPLTVRV